MDIDKETDGLRYGHRQRDRRTEIWTYRKTSREMEIPKDREMGV